jgi:hypothetical protein
LKKSILIILFFIPYVLPAQQDRIKVIDSLCKSINDKVLLAVKGGEESWGGLYCNEVVLNKYSNQWRAVGIYECNIKFFYTDQPWVAEQDSNSKESVLVKTEVRSELSINKFDYEFFYDEGSLILLKMKQKIAEQPEASFCWYFNKEKEIIRSSSGNIDAGDGDLEGALKLSKEYTELFLKMF